MADCGLGSAYNVSSVRFDGVHVHDAIQTRAEGESRSRHPPTIRGRGVRWGGGGGRPTPGFVGVRGGSGSRGSWTEPFQERGGDSGGGSGGVGG